MFEFRLPDVGEGIQEGEIVKWHVKEGDAVKHDQLLAEVETDKAVVEITSPRDGTISKIGHKEGETVKVGEILVVIAERGEKAQAVQESDHYTSSVVGHLDESEQIIERKEVKQSSERGGVKATPAVRKLAKELGVNIEGLKGSGEGGRITEDDVRGGKTARAETTRAEEEKNEPVEAVKSESGEVIEGVHQVKKFDFYGYIDHVPFKGVRKATAQHMTQSWTKAVHVTHMDEADVTELWNIREKEKEIAKAKGIRLTFMPFIVRSAIAALREHPILNSTLDEEHSEIIVKKYFNIGIAVDTPDGLMAPSLKEADKMSIMTLATEIEKLAKAAAERKLDVADFKGGSFTITNVGALGGLYATPIINYPEAAILAVGRIYDKAVPRGGKIEPRKILPFSVTFDHRVLDGAECARFANKFKEELENPELTLME